MQNTVAVVGSRGLAQLPALLARLNELRALGQLDQVVSGGAAGVDALAAAWCRAQCVPLLELRPDYAAHGPAAPHVRNAEIVRQASRVLVCWDGQSRGTLSAARAAARLGRRCEWLAAPPPATSLGL
jgi:YspA, cpYpsA-related SLOG family